MVPWGDGDMVPCSWLIWYVDMVPWGDGSWLICALGGWQLVDMDMAAG